MRKFALAATAVAALTVGLQTPAFAAAPDAPTDLVLGWADGKVHLTWKDNGEGNRIYAAYDDAAPTLVQQILAGNPNDVTLVNPLLASDKVRLIVEADNGTEVSPGTASQFFDTRRPAVPALQDANLATNLTTQLSWTLNAVPDSTPNDPLDVPGNGSVKANVDLPGTATASHIFDAGTTSGVLPVQARPAAIKLSAVNEWGESAQDAKIVRLGTLGAGITVPASAVYTTRLGIKSTVDLFTSEGREERASNVKVELQARAKAADAWKTYGRYTGNTTAAFDTGIASLGNRQYRLYLPARKVVSGNVIALTPAASTSARSSATLIKFVSAGFTPPNPRAGANVDLTAKIQPASTVRGNLQYFDGRGWLNNSAVQFRNGSLLEHGGAGDEPRTTRFRIALPAVTVNGLTLSATQSAPFTLTIR